MSAIENKKQQRSKSKLLVSTTAKRLTSSVERNMDFHVINSVTQELEDAFETFVINHCEYDELVQGPDNEAERTVNGLDMEAYYEQVFESYSDAKRVYTDAKESHEETLRAKHSAPLKNTFAREVKRLRSFIKDVNEHFSGEPDIVTLQMDLESLDTSIKSIHKVVEQLVNVNGHDNVKEEEETIDELLETVDKLRRKITILIRKHARETTSPPASTTADSTTHATAQSSTSETTTAQSSDQNSEEQSSNSEQTRSRPTQVKLKRMELPRFSGHRKDWPEFKSVWKELAESAITNKLALAHELKQSVKGAASERIQSVYVTKADAYGKMWAKLEEFYEDASASIQAALDNLKTLRPVADTDYRGLVRLVDEVESSYSQLEELSSVETLTLRDIDHVTSLLPNQLTIEWNRKFHDLTGPDRLKPFPEFMKFLERERATVIRLAENQPRKVKAAVNFTENDKYSQNLPDRKHKFSCAYHNQIDAKHVTSSCKAFRKLDIDGKREILMKARLCFICFGDHPRYKCPSRQLCSICGKGEHHQLLCRQNNNRNDSQSPPETVSPTKDAAKGDSNVTQSNTMALYPILQVGVWGSRKEVAVFCDGGSNTSYITHAAAARIGAKQSKKLTLDITTMGNVNKSYKTCEYEVVLRTHDGKSASITAFGMQYITGPVNVLHLDSLAALFPSYDPQALQRKSRSVDILLGCDYFGLHPKHELDSSGEHLSIMQGPLGVCLQGSHPDLKEATVKDTNLARTVHDVRMTGDSNHVLTVSHTEYTKPLMPREKCKATSTNVSQSFSVKAIESRVSSFINGEELATETTPKCGNCRCGKCPTVGHTYSFNEEQELSMIRENLEYDDQKKCWTTAYPWVTDPNTLPDNYSSAIATLRNTEKRLQREPQWAETYKAQIQDMVDRNVARILPQEELDKWDGPKFYISHLAVSNPRSDSTPVRIVFNSSQLFKGVSLNSYLAKGPDSYMNSILGLLLRWRENEVAIVGDIKKMFNAVHLKLPEQHCHRFLWRDSPDKPPVTYVIQRVNMGDKPAPAISTEALYKTAEMFQNDSPSAARFIQKSTYVDDLIDSVEDTHEARQLIKDVEDMLNKGGFSVKCWLISGDDESGGNDDQLRVLGLGWQRHHDAIVFDVTLNFSPKRKGQRIGLNLTRDEVPRMIPAILTRRSVLEQVMAIFDPLGLICPFTLTAKLHLRETWARQLGWDDQLPSDMAAKWKRFFTDMFEMEMLHLPRCLKPPQAVGQPWLILLCDGSNVAYGFAAYVRWKLSNGKYWCRLIMAKSRIAPMTKRSTPQMELNAAVLSKRGRAVIEKEMRFSFDRILHLVDSETVLCMINKTSTRFQVYEGVRIGEIQAATNGDMSQWAWISGNHNTADWLTRGRTPKQLNADSEWFRGPDVLYKPIEEWHLKFGQQRDSQMPGEKVVRQTNNVSTDIPIESMIKYERFRTFEMLVWTVARILNVSSKLSFSAGKRNKVTADDLREAEKFIVKDIQSTIKEELEKSALRKGSGGRYSRLTPTKDEDGLWVVGERLTKYNAMVLGSSPQKLLPTRHPGTRLLMERAHESGHRGRIGTLATFRQHYWTPHGDKLARAVKNNCQMCKLREPKLLQQRMGMLPETRLKPCPPFTNSMVDLFGPYTIRGDVNKRSSGKAYGVIFTDLVMRAVHIEAVFGYDTESFLMALSRFASVRGWPATIYSDRGTQLIGADRELKEAWAKLDGNKLKEDGVHKGLDWVFGPADSPWYQGAVESLVKAAKRAIAFSMEGKRLSSSEFLTVCTEVANVINERPIGYLPDHESDINVLTPNSLLLGRATAKNPGEWQPRSSLLTRYSLVQQIADEFWKKWVELYVPTLIFRNKWPSPQRNLKPGDVVLVADKNNLRGDYTLGKVKEVFPGTDGKVRQVSVILQHAAKGNDSKAVKYKARKDTVVRSVHRLALLAPVEADSQDNIK